MQILRRVPRRAFPFIFIALLWILYFHDLPGLNSLRKYSRTRQALRILSNAGWGSFNPRAQIPGESLGRWLDLRGFRSEDGFAWGRLSVWRSRCRAVENWRRQVFPPRTSPDILLPVEEENWDKLMGSWTGEWKKYQVDLTTTKRMDEYSKDVDTAFLRGSGAKDPMMDIIGNEGRVTARFEDIKSLEMEVFDTMSYEWELGYSDEVAVSRDVRLVREIAATVTIQDGNSSDGSFNLNVYGVHWPRIGLTLMTTTSENFDGIFGLPQLTTGWEYSTTSRHLLSATVGKTPAGTRAISFGKSHSPTTDTIRNASQCQYVLHMQMHPTEKQIMWADVSEPEVLPNCTNYLVVGNLESPMSMLIFSPDCGFLLEMKGRHYDWSNKNNDWFACH